MLTVTIDKKWGVGLAKELEKFRVATKNAKTPAERREVAEALSTFSRKLSDLLILRLLGDDSRPFDPSNDARPVVPPPFARAPMWEKFHDTLFWPAKELCQGLLLLANGEAILARALKRGSPSRYLEKVTKKFERDRKAYFLGESSTVQKFSRALNRAVAALDQSRKAMASRVLNVEEWNEVRPQEPVERGVRVVIPSQAVARIEGFDVVLVGAEDSTESRNQIARLTAVLRTFRQRMTRIAPRIVERLTRVRLFVDLLGASPRTASGTFFPEENKIVLYPTHIPDEARYVHTLAHELGHVVFQRVLGAQTQFAWYRFIEGDMGELDVERLLAKWPTDEYGEHVPLEHVFREIKDEDPVLALQVEALATGWGTRTYYSKDYEWFEREAREKGAALEIRVPSTPITAYANVSPEEAFCEAFGMLVAYGPRTILPRVYLWLETVLGADVRRGTAAGRQRVRGRIRR